MDWQGRQGSLAAGPWVGAGGVGEGVSRCGIPRLLILGPGFLAPRRTLFPTSPGSCGAVKPARTLFVAGKCWPPGVAFPQPLSRAAAVGLCCPEVSPVGRGSSPVSWPPTLPEHLCLAWTELSSDGDRPRGEGTAPTPPTAPPAWLGPGWTATTCLRTGSWAVTVQVTERGGDPVRGPWDRTRSPCPAQEWPPLRKHLCACRDPLGLCGYGGHFAHTQCAPPLSQPLSVRVGKRGLSAPL